MSYERRGGYRRRHRDDYDDRRREVHETPEEKLKAAIIKLGEVDPVEELPRLQKQIQEHVPLNIANISEAIRVASTQQPYKIPYYVALIWLLHERPPDSTDNTGALLGRLVLEDIWKGFQAYLDKLAWREVRLGIHFFAHLTIANLVTTDSMISLLQSFTSVLDEFGVSYGRAKRAALCAAEGLMISGPVLKPYSPQSVEDMIAAVRAFRDTTGSERWLVKPLAKTYGHTKDDEADADGSGATAGTGAGSGNNGELLEVLIRVLTTINDSDFAQTPESFPQPYLTLPELDFSTITPFVLPSILVPPDIIELDTLSTDMEDESQIKKEEWPEYFLRLFDNDISPDPTTLAGYAVRSALLDIISIFEVNRKECARLLLEYPKWNLPGAFKPKPGATQASSLSSSEVEPVPGKDWQLESTIVETILGALLILPESPHKSVYYVSLITELCKLSPSTVGPAVGKSIRKLYASLGDGLDVEAARRFAEWFSVHMSNFGFQWVWKEWIPDLTLAVQHPRRSFMRRAVEFEIRLAYHDRILKTLPETMQAPDAFVVPENAPGPDFEYDDSASPHHDAAQSVLNLFRGRAKAEDVISHLDTLKATLETSEDGGGGSGGHMNVDALVRSITVQSLLHIGSRSFSHLLNAIERYLPLLRNISTVSPGTGNGTGTGGTGSGGGSVVVGGGSPEAKADILAAAAAFWKQNRQMVGIVFDKLMQYQIVDPTDVIGWTFVNGAVVSPGGAVGTGDGSGVGPLMSLNAWEWDLMRAALDKANGRVVIARRKVTALRKEEDDTRARAKARANDNTMEVDADAKQDEETPMDSPALTTAIKAFTSLTREQKAALSRTLEGFVSCLASPDSNPHARTVITEDAWQNRANWDNDEWNAWETWGWYRQFCRAYSPYLRTYTNTLYAVSFSKLEDSSDPAARLMIKTWQVATGQDVS